MTEALRAGRNAYSLSLEGEVESSEEEVDFPSVGSVKSSQKRSVRDENVGLNSKV